MSDSMPNFWDEGVTSGENNNSYGSVLQEENIAVAFASNGNNGNGNGNGQGNNGNGQGHICTDPDEHGPQGMATVMDTTRGDCLSRRIFPLEKPLSHMEAIPRRNILQRLE